MKDPRDWNELDILALPFGEFNWLDAKVRRGLDLTIPDVKESDVLHNLSIAISAFANSGGGQIIFGLKDPKHTKLWEIDDGGIDLFVKKNGTHDWLEDVIPNQVDPVLTAFNFYQITNTLENSQIFEERAVFIVDVQDSLQAPHQAYDHIYYARVGSKSRPLGHRFVSDIFNRRQYPKFDLEFEFELKESMESPGNSSLFAQRYDVGVKSSPRLVRYNKLQVYARNVGRVYAQYVTIHVWVPRNLAHEGYLGWSKKPDEKAYIVLRDTNQEVLTKSTGFGGKTQDGQPWYEPILPSLGFRKSWWLSSNVTDEVLNNDETIRWKVYADNSQSEGTVKIRDIPRNRIKDDLENSGG